MIRNGQNWGSTSLDEVSKFNKDRNEFIKNEVFEIEVLTVRSSQVKDIKNEEQIKDFAKANQVKKKIKLYSTLKINENSTKVLTIST